jgi:hypothetical protein
MTAVGRNSSGGWKAGGPDSMIYLAPFPAPENRHFSREPIIIANPPTSDPERG